MPRLAPRTIAVMATVAARSTFQMARPVDPDRSHPIAAGAARSGRAAVMNRAGVEGTPPHHIQYVATATAYVITVAARPTTRRALASRGRSMTPPAAAAIAGA